MPGALSEALYSERKVSAKFEADKKRERAIIASKTSALSTYVLASGLLYGKYVCPHSTSSLICTFTLVVYLHHSREGKSLTY